VNKKKQKNFDSLRFWRCWCHGHHKQKFFGSFFQKRTAFFRLAARLAD
jgi:hypothetical protein